MHLVVNGDDTEHTGDGSLDALLREMGASGRPVAVLVNGEVIREPIRKSVVLRDGDVVEIIGFAGGG